MIMRSLIYAFSRPLVTNRFSSILFITFYIYSNMVYIKKNFGLLTISVGWVRSGFVKSGYGPRIRIRKKSYESVTLVLNSLSRVGEYQVRGMKECILNGRYILLGT
jgi:hypothetical protein